MSDPILGSPNESRETEPVTASPKHVALIGKDGVATLGWLWGTSKTRLDLHTQHYNGLSRGESDKAVIATESGNFFLVRNGFIIDAQKSAESGRVVHRDTQEEITMPITIGDKLTMGGQETSSVTYVMVDTGMGGAVTDGLDAGENPVDQVEAYLRQTVADYDQKVMDLAAS